MSVKAITEAWAWIAGGEAKTAAEKLVILRIADHVSDETQEAFPSSRHLARMTALGRATVQRSLRSLDGRAFRAERRKSRHGDDAATLYHWLLKGWPHGEATLPISEQAVQGGGLTQQPGVAPPESHGGLAQQPEPPLNRQVESPQPQGRSGDGAFAPENQTPSQEIKWPDNLGGHQDNITTIMLDGNIPPADRQTFVCELSDVLAGGKIKKTVEAYARGMIGRGWQPSPEVVRQKEDDALSAELQLIKDGLDRGGCLLVNGEQAEVEWPLAQIGNGFANVAALIQQGAAVEVQHF